MKITEVRINGIENPIGYDLSTIVCSWKVVQTSSKKQQSARIQVSRQKDFSDILFEKQGENLAQAGETIDVSLESETTYYFRIQVTGDQGDQAVSDTCFFETGKMKRNWQAQWISIQENEDIHPFLQKEFVLEKAVKRARFYGTGVGLFELYLNGEKQGEEYLAPGIHNYEAGIQTQVFPVEHLQQGSNTLGILLGKGWYMGTFGLEGQKDNYGNRMAAIGELHLEYEDGTKEMIPTDSSWSYRGSDIEESGIYFGEIINRCLWENRENQWKQVVVLEQPQTKMGTRNLDKDKLTDRLSLPVKVQEELEVQNILITPAGETVLDMGQNFAGFLEIDVDLPRKSKVVLDFGEILQNGNFYRENYRDAVSQFVYVSDGRKETVHPHFTFFGFRYVRVSGWTGELKKENFRGKVLYSSLSRTGYLKTSSQKLNRLYENTLWGLKSNFIDIPTDCPQRNERLGWTGDAQVFAPTASYHMDTRAFFHKFVKDLRDEQKILGKAVPNYIPNLGHKRDVGSVWGDIATFLPYTLYQHYGNMQEMEYCYPLMKDWVDYITEEDEKRENPHRLFDFGFHFGDWLALDGATPTSFKGSTDDYYIGSMYYFRSLEMTGEIAERLGKKQDAEYYFGLAKEVKQAILNEYFTPNGRLALNTQAAYVVALKFHVYHNKERLIQQFKDRLKMDGNQIKCGFVGAPMLCSVLAECNLYELAYEFLLNEKFPSWLYCVNLGATTVWERWNSVLEDGTISGTGMNSLNHYAYGSVMEFMYGYGAGIRPMEPGFKKAILEPHPDIRLPKVECTYDSVNGSYRVDFEICSDGKLQLEAEVPFNCTAVLTLPDSGEKPKLLEAGVHRFCYMPLVDYRKPYQKNVSLHRIGKDKAALAVLARFTPALAGMAAADEGEFAYCSLEEISHLEFLPYDPGQLENAIQELAQWNVMEQHN